MYKHCLNYNNEEQSLFVYEKKLQKYCIYKQSIYKRDGKNKGTQIIYKKTRNIMFKEIMQFK